MSVDAPAYVSGINVTSLAIIRGIPTPTSNGSVQLDRFALDNPTELKESGRY